MAPKVIIELRKREAADTEGYLYIRVPIIGSPPYYREPLGYKVPVDLWDKDNEMILRAYPNAAIINAGNQKKRDAAQEKLDREHAAGRAVTKSVAERFFESHSDKSLETVYQQYIAKLGQPRKTTRDRVTKYSTNYIKKHTTILNNLLKYKSAIYFSDIDKKWMEGLENKWAEWMNADTTLSNDLTKFSTFLVYAEEEGYFSFEQVKGYKWPKYRNPDKPYLTLTQIDDLLKKIEKGEFDSDIPLKIVACFFLVECLSGLRFSDWHRFVVERMIEKDRIKVRTHKTGAPIYVSIDKSPRLKKVIGLIQKNQFEFTFTEQHTNRCLKLIGTLLKLDFPLTTHVGRHTCATLFLELGYSEVYVAEILGVSLRTVLIYAKITRTKLQREYDRLGGL